MRNNYFGICLIALVTLMTELTLMRLFDAALGANLAYMVITCAIFAFGLAGIVLTLRPMSKVGDDALKPANLSILFAGSLLLVPIIMEAIPFEWWEFGGISVRTAMSFGILYLAIIVPFFVSGLVITILISSHPGAIRQLYFWDLAGAGIGSIVVVPLLPVIGPGGILVVGSGLALLAAWQFGSSRSSLLRVAVGAGLGVLMVAIWMPGNIFTFTDLTVERFASEDRTDVLGRLELTVWDPVSKIDVLNLDSGRMKGLSYDGGAQHSAFTEFDGDFLRLRREPELLQGQIWNLAVIAAHYLKRDSNQKVFIIGSAGGQEIKAALTYNPARVDAVEMVGAVVDLGKTVYAEFIGNLFDHPKVNVITGEGRTVLRSSSSEYDIIQIYSNHTTSSVASGTGAMVTGYLYTVEAFHEYFGKLTDNGVLQMNQFLYPRLITAGAQAWKRMGRKDFQKHVVVVELGEGDWLPTVLIKMQPWTDEELGELKKVFFEFPNWHGRRFRISEDPKKPEASFLEPVFYSGTIPEEVQRRVEYRIDPATDDRPYFVFVRERLGRVEASEEKFMNEATADLLNRQILRSWLSADFYHFVVIGAASCFYGFVFIVVPLWVSKVGRGRWPGKGCALGFFSCLGAGFIIFELVLIQIFMHFIGFPLYTYSLTIFSLLMGAAIGSLSSIGLNVSPSGRWSLPFIGIGLMGGFLVSAHQAIFGVFLGDPTWVRMVVASLLIMPFGFFLGMAFPMGITLMERMAREAIPWMWGMNGLFTVIGGLLSVLLSLFYGFRVTFLVGLGIYVVAFVLFWRLRKVLVREDASQEVQRWDTRIASVWQGP